VSSAGEPNAQRRAVESVSQGEVLVIEARGEEGAGTIGDILALRALRRGAAGIVTDGGLRDSPAVSALDIPAYFRAPHASVLGALHHPLEENVPITCAGVLVLPGDVLVGDAEGVVVVPAQLADEVAAAAVEQESRERFAFERVDAGESTGGLFPLGDGRMADYEAWRLLDHAAFRVGSPGDLDAIRDTFEALGCPVREVEGVELGQGPAVRVHDPLGFPLEFFHEMEHADCLLPAVADLLQRLGIPAGELGETTVESSRGEPVGVLRVVATPQR
jgi:regulator of RNase E activity RraA